MSVRDLTAGDDALVDQLLDQHEFKPYRAYRLLSRAKQSAVLRTESDRVLKAAGGFGVVARSGDAVAIAMGHPLPWDSGFFGVAMGRVDYLLRSPGAERGALADALSAAVSRLHDGGAQHIAIKLDVADGDAISVVQDEGFRLMDALVTYIAHPRRPAPHSLKAIGKIRAFDPADTPQVLEITDEAYRGFRGRFQIDPHLPKERSDAFYLEWARKCLSGDMADRVLVAEGAGGRLYGWASVKRAEPVSTVGGAVVSSGSLGACRADAPGAYAGLISAAAAENHAAGVLTEASTQNSNGAMIRVLESVGAQYARTDYTFHKWLG